ncbi:MAG: hypothetical protein KDD73_17780, partial [Anaerolineales bacterium]|nr:hypothetical protein [Anaerolineales bacterium]
MAEVSQVVQCARVLSLADAMCAMRANRPYRPGLGRDEAMRSLGAVCVGGLDAPLAAVVERVSVATWQQAAAA